MTDNEDESMQDYDAATAGQNVKESREKELVPNIGIRGVKHFIENLKRRLRNLGKKAEALIPKKSAEAKAYEKIAGSLGILVIGAKQSGKQTFMLVIENLFGDSENNPLCCECYHCEKLARYSLSTNTLRCTGAIR